MTVLRLAAAAAVSCASATAAAQPAAQQAMPQEIALARVAAKSGDPIEMLVQHFTSVDPRSGEAVSLPKGAVVAMSVACPDGWAPYRDTDGAELYFPLGLLVDENGAPRVNSYTLLPACRKQ